MSQAIAALTAGGNKSWADVNVAITGRDTGKFATIAATGVVPASKLCRCDQWIVLARRHAQTILELRRNSDKPLMEAFAGVKAPDEIYFPTCLSLAGIASLDHAHAVEAKRRQDSTRKELYNLPPAKSAPIPLPDDGVLRRRLAYCSWPSRSATSPSYLKLTAAVVAAAVAEGCLTMRKFKSVEVAVHEWKALVLDGGWARGSDDTGAGAGAGAGAAAAPGAGGQSDRVLLSAIGHKPKPKLSAEEQKAKALADSKKYRWNEESWDKLATTHRNVAVVCAGDRWLDLTGREWLACPTRNFEVHVIYYGANPDVLRELRAAADEVFEDTGPKWHLLTRYSKFVPWFKFEFLWFPDDDMLIAGADVSRVFEFAKDNQLHLSQPAVVPDDIGKGSHPILQQVDGMAFRLVNFVECQAPLFFRDLYVMVAKHFERLQPATGFGIDSVWSHVALDAGCRIGVVDCLPMKWVSRCVVVLCCVCGVCLCVSVSVHLCLCVCVFGRVASPLGAWC